jgi:hypothetical protein
MSNIPLEQISIATVFSLPLTDFRIDKAGLQAPDTPGVYIILQTHPIQKVWYVGMSKSLKYRMKTHDLARVFEILVHGGCAIKFAFVELPGWGRAEVNAAEVVFIKRLRPFFNTTHAETEDIMSRAAMGLEAFPSPRKTRTIRSQEETVKQLSALIDLNNFDSELENKTIRELKTIASLFMIPKYSDLTKGELISEISNSKVLMSNEKN